MTKVNNFIKSLSILLENWYFSLFGKTPDHSKEISFRYEQIKKNISRCISYRHVEACQELIITLLVAPYGIEAMEHVDKLRCLLKTKENSIKRRAEMKFADEVIAKALKSA